MTSLAIDNAARDSMMQLAGQNWFTRSLSGSYKMTNDSRVHKLFFKNQRSHRGNTQQVRDSLASRLFSSGCEKSGLGTRLKFVRESTELIVDERIEDGESMAMPNEFYNKQCHV